MDQSHHLRDIKLLLAILVAAVVLGGFLYLQSISDKAERDADRSAQQLEDAGKVLDGAVP